MNDQMKKIAEDLLSVQPMPSDVMTNLFKAAIDQTELEKDGYRPVSRLGLLWVKEDCEPYKDE